MLRVSVSKVEVIKPTKVAAAEVARVDLGIDGSEIIPLSVGNQIAKIGKRLIPNLLIGRIDVIPIRIAQST